MARSIRFENREEAARLLLKKLSSFQGRNPLILGIPRGAMPMAKIIAEGLDGELGAILVHKIPTPGYEELAMGSVGLSGKLFRNAAVIRIYDVPEVLVQTAAAEQIKALKKKQSQYHLPMPNYHDRIVILVDDGIATGATVMGAIHEVREQQPKKIIVATAAIAHDTAQKIQPLVDEIIALTESDEFYAVSQFFQSFSQVTDEEVVEILRSFKESAKRQNSMKSSFLS